MHCQVSPGMVWYGGIWLFFKGVKLSHLVPVKISLNASAYQDIANNFIIPTV